MSPSGGDRIVPVAFGVDDSRGVARYAGRQIDRVGVGGRALCVHKIRTRLEGVIGCAVGVVGGLGEVGGGDGVAGYRLSGRVSFHFECSQCPGHAGWSSEANRFVAGCSGIRIVAGF